MRGYGDNGPGPEVRVNASFIKYQSWLSGNWECDMAIYAVVKCTSIPIGCSNILQMLIVMRYHIIVLAGEYIVLILGIEYFPADLWLLTLELSYWDLPEVFNRNLVQMLTGCSYLEPVLEQDVIRFIHELRVNRNILDTAEFGIPFSPAPPGFKLQSLSLVLVIISDELISSITDSLPFLIELHLEDRPSKEPSPFHDLTNSGLQSLRFCRHLTDISLIRSRHNLPVYFKRINDMGMFLLSEGCRLLESVRLGGFCRVSDAGFASILHSCWHLKKFEVRNALLLSDLAFHDLTGAPCSLVEVKLSSCNLITSETVHKMASSRRLEVLDLFGCKSIADSSLSSITCLNKLTTLNLGGADVTDRGLSVLSQGYSPISHLCLRGCKRVTDKGVSLLFHGCGVISKTLTALDLGHMPGISDKAILTIAAVGTGITELCIRYCFYVTDSSVEALATKRRLQDGRKPLRKLDLFHCTGLSIKSLESLKRPFFQALKWIGLGRTCLSGKGNEICNERPWLTLCLDGCEMGCHDGWHFHRPETRDH
ncbi:F-box protein At-B [Vitis vinifera]|uniref:F-box protein At-B n=1 Tax=Vitis vinifera TaxID=29760 RepID=A0A438DU18_VITVI|nr:F-box protein At-B [Vitis vinifera]